MKLLVAFLTLLAIWGFVGGVISESVWLVQPTSDDYTLRVVQGLHKVESILSFLLGAVSSIGAAILVYLSNRTAVAQLPQTVSHKA